MYRYNKRNMSLELLRDLYESWLILAMGMLVRWNRWRPLSNAIISPLDPKPYAIGDNERWADVYFECGLLLAILQYRPLWVRRCRHRVRLLMLLSEIVLLLQLVHWIDCQPWQSFLGIVEELFLALGRGQWGSSFLRCPAEVRTLLLRGYVFDVFRLLSSFGIFSVALNSTAGEWRVSLDFLLIGCLPKSSVRRRCLYVDYKKRDFERRCNGLPPNPPPELLIYKRMCCLCLQQLKSAPMAPEIRKEQCHSYLSILFTAANAFK
ncbi:uncharacterized protein LOC6550287 [Drosophila erecta]|uniref:Uncharacterized protein n=1 Tax=Drosophila erecta TaxID=7220 RepID=B3NTB2_DROER|nr:uncharacterized protein LOC6550287 [Drosophila erecta]EDV46563.1 uncharacterized protein Dere_GG18140 [Drosophila erecta]